MPEPAAPAVKGIEITDEALAAFQEQIGLTFERVPGDPSALVYETGFYYRGRLPLELRLTLLEDEDGKRAWLVSDYGITHYRIHRALMSGIVGDEKTPQEEFPEVWALCPTPLQTSVLRKFIHHLQECGEFMARGSPVLELVNRRIIVERLGVVVPNGQA